MNRRILFRQGAGAAVLVMGLTAIGRGIGFAQAMRERAEELGGRFAIAPRPDGPGTRLTVRLPLPTRPEAEAGA